MTVVLHDTAPPPADSMELLRGMLEEQFAVSTAKLTQLTVAARLPRHPDYDPHTLDAFLASARQQIAETAFALRRMTEGTYGLCEDCHKPLPLGRLHAVPHAAYCTLCDRHQPY